MNQNELNQKHRLIHMRLITPNQLKFWKTHTKQI